MDEYTAKLDEIVHFVFTQGYERTAIVTKVWSPHCVNLMVICDGANDQYRGPNEGHPMKWFTSVNLDASANGGWTFHPAH